MKKFTSLLLTLVMLLCMGSSVLAQNVAPENESKKNSDYVQEINGSQIDLRRNVAPEGLKKSKTRSIVNDSGAQTATDVEVKKETSRKLRASMPTGGGEYPYNPSYWNSSSNIYRANCYGYALNRIANNTSDPYSGYMFQPGFRTGNYYTSLSTTAIIRAATSDLSNMGRTIRSASYYDVPRYNEYKIALVIANNDYHWYRQDSDGGWSHKPGLTAVTYKDASGNYISDPYTCNRNYSYANYNTWGGYYIISK